MGSRTLTDLPVEVLHMVFAHDKWLWKHQFLPSCSFTCRLLRAVALEHLDFRRLSLSYIETFDPLLEFLRTYPRVAKTVVSLRLYGRRTCYPDPLPTTTIDDALVASIVELLPKLNSLTLFSFKYVKSTAANAQPAAGPFPLSTFVLSLFTPKTKSIVELRLERFDIEEPFEPRFLHRLVDIERLRLSRSIKGGPACTALAVQALSVSLKSDSLQELSVNIDSKETVYALGKLLSRAGGNITNLTIRHTRLTSDDHDPLEGSWQLLDVAACKKLETIILSMHFSETRTGPLSGPVVGILQRASPTLRKVIIMVDDLPRPTTLGNRTIFKIHDVDKVLSAARFPYLQECELNIGHQVDCKVTPLGWEKCKNSVQRALKSLHGRGLLTLNRH
ncbi:hypothetical protein L227DRAFT_614920 [Lentinus tigrinus ALCF2SS1-6]|uniref:F-box domain-containing protein n=1 Tax=Lentinus tigrinus ALCF2SS1-6 TaxID=1328759 RepID=A0A5C2RYB5_9APHY|nr:hypothetical protein L227DRAFT_614920 [Lentinus tigrinus ALCF2SS1-6]